MERYSAEAKIVLQFHVDGMSYSPKVLNFHYNV